ncbi:hypothetical protein [Rhodococcus chondri]|uniref:Uncharacterized protein n=1 Tax=Rhodococcus chondri TaxID=3065941 RepID=A0ABU7JNN2_9NOCA|nr:hypothetical protein [Rhodococcus sp. CC-R104]MEE2031327.1 hypothetical protein [Rhodococcus sp. CC-R104]
MQPDFVLDVANGSADLSRHLTESLRTLAAAAPDPEFRRLVEQVLGGDLGVRALARTDAFAAFLDSFATDDIARMQSLSPEELEQLAAKHRTGR